MQGKHCQLRLTKVNICIEIKYLRRQEVWPQWKQFVQFMSNSSLNLLSILHCSLVKSHSYMIKNLECNREKDADFIASKYRYKLSVQKNSNDNIMVWIYFDLPSFDPNNPLLM